MLYYMLDAQLFLQHVLIRHRQQCLHLCCNNGNPDLTSLVTITARVCLSHTNRAVSSIPIA
jgi:hypothetical protein